MNALAFLTLLLGASVWTAWRGTFEHRVVIAVLLVGSFATYIAFRWGSEDWLRPTALMIGIDVVALAIFGFVALRSKRFWPLSIAGLQIIPVMTHLAGPLATHKIGQALGMMQGFWAYVQLVIVACAAWHEHRKAKNETGFY